MKPTWLIETGVWEDGNEERMIVLLRDLGLTVHAEDYTYLGGTEFEMASEDVPIIYYGSLPTAEYLQLRHRNWVPFIWHDAGVFNCHSYYAHWGDLLLQERYGFYPLGELGRIKDMLCAQYAGEGLLFVRPNDNNKLFTGRLVSVDLYDDWLQELEARALPAAELVVVAAPVEIVGEWRFVIADRKVIAGSHYRWSAPQRATNDLNRAAARFAAKVAAHSWQPRPIYCADVALTGQDEYRLVEINGINSAGLYRCDLTRIVQAMNEIAIRDYRHWKGI